MKSIGEASKRGTHGKGRGIDRRIIRDRVQEIVRVTREDERYVRKYRKMNMSTHEIAIALGIPEETVNMVS